MSQELQTTSNNAVGPHTGRYPAHIVPAIKFSDNEIAVIRNSIAPGMPPAAFNWFIAASAAMGLNPIKKEVYPLPFKDESGNTRWIFHTGIDAFYRRVFESGVFLGWEETVLTVKSPDGLLRETTMRMFDPDGEDKLVSATIGIRIKGFPEPARTTVHFKRYAKFNKEGQPQSSWKSRPERMLEKCGQGKVVRENIPGCAQLYLREEMDQLDTDFIDAEFGPADPANVPPKTPAPKVVTRAPKGQKLVKPEAEAATEQEAAAPTEEPEEARADATAEATQEQAQAVEPDPEIAKLMTTIEKYLRTTHNVQDEGIAFARSLINEHFGVPDPAHIPGDKRDELNKFCRTTVLATMQEKLWIQPPQKAGA